MPGLLLLLCVTPQRSAIACLARNAAARQVLVEPAPPPRRQPLGPLPVNGLAALLGLAFLAASLLRRPPGAAPPAAVEERPLSAEQETAKVAEELSSDLEAVAQEQALDSPAPPPAAVEERPLSAEQETAKVAEQLASDLEAVVQEQALDSPAPPPAAVEERPLSAEQETAKVAEQLASDLEAVVQEQALDSPAPPPAPCAPATASASYLPCVLSPPWFCPVLRVCSPVLDSTRQAVPALCSLTFMVLPCAASVLFNSARQALPLSDMQPRPYACCPAARRPPARLSAQEGAQGPRRGAGAAGGRRGAARGQRRAAGAAAPV